MKHIALVLVLSFVVASLAAAAEPAGPEAQRLQRLLKRFPDADANGDGVLTRQEAQAYRRKVLRQQRNGNQPNRTPPRGQGGKPTHADSKYAEHQRNAIDLWLAKSETPTPLVIFIHGGGFQGGDKRIVAGRFGGVIQKCLASGVSFASINYRLTGDGVNLRGCLHDSARAVQFLRYNAAKYNLDKKRFAAFGTSAGAGTSLWLAVHEDLADPKAGDPVLRESTRLSAAGSLAGQCTYDFTRGEELLGPYGAKGEQNAGVTEGRRIYGLTDVEDLDKPEIKALRADADMIALLTKDDPPIFLHSSGSLEPAINRGHYSHPPKHSVLLKERADKVGVEAELVLPAKEPGLRTGAVDDRLVKFFFKHLKVEANEAGRTE